MKARFKILFFVVILLVLTIKGFAQLDTLNSVFEFESPSENDWGISYDGTNLWISDMENGTVYKTSTDGTVLDSITISGAMIKGIEFVNDTLWALNSNIVGDTNIYGSSYPIFSLYQIDKSSGFIIDSIIIVSPATNIQSGFLWGLCYNTSFFNISFNGGYGPCLVKVDPINNTQEFLCCTHLSGMTSINDSIWGLNNESTIVTTNGQVEIPEYKINISASDLAYDGNGFWVVDMNSNKIHQLEPIILTLNDALQNQNKLSIYPTPASDYLQVLFKPTYVEKIELYNLQGQGVKTIYPNKNISYFKLNVSDIKSGIYIFIMNTGMQTFKEKIIIINNN
jgi:type IX secretion system substrate protein